MSDLELPNVCGVMLLPDCVFFPHGGLPLHIFEPRYRRMLRDALQGHCFLAVTCLLREETRDPGECTAKIGTLGLIRASRQRADGTSDLMLQGISRVEFSEWHVGAPYPCARIRPVPALFTPASQTRAALESLREAAEFALLDFHEELRQAFRTVSATIDDPAILCDILAHQFLRDSEERQTMLEMEPVAARIAWICRRLRK